jgi:hypothetical protein
MKRATAVAVKPARKLNAAHPTPTPAPVVALKSAKELEFEADKQKFIEEVSGMSCYDVIPLSVALKAVRREATLKYPAEDFIYSILDEYRVSKGLTPDTARDLLELFAREFEAMRAASREFIATYGMVS